MDKVSRGAGRQVKQTAARFFCWERRCGYRYNLYPALQGSGGKNGCPDDGGSVCLPKKIGVVSAYLCDPASAPAEFLLTKSQYQAETGRAVERGALFFQIRQAFPPGEVTPEEANKIGYETAMRWTKGKYQFFVCTHIDKGHIHNHIYYNSTAQDCSRKFHNFIGSSFAVRRLSDRVCIEHELSVIQNPKQHSKGRFLHYGQWIGEKPPSAQQRVRLAIVEALEQKPTDFPAFLRLMEESGFQVKHGRRGAISFLAPGQDKYTRLRASTLGPGFDPDDIRAAIAGERPIPELPQDSPAPARRVNLIIDIQERMAQGKGPAYGSGSQAGRGAAGHGGRPFQNLRAHGRGGAVCKDAACV